MLAADASETLYPVFQFAMVIIDILNRENLISYSFIRWCIQLDMFDVFFAVEPVIIHMTITAQNHVWSQTW